MGGVAIGTSDTIPPETDPAKLYPPTGPFTAASDQGGGPDGRTYIDGPPPAPYNTTEPTTSCGPLSAWNDPTAPIQNLLKSSNVAGDPALVAITMSEGNDCLTGAGVRNAVATVTGWANAKKFEYTGTGARGDVIIAKYGWVNDVAPLMALWPGNAAGDAAKIDCRDTKYHVIHAHIYTDSDKTLAKAVHLFATRVQGSSICETAQLDDFIRAKTAPTDRVLMMGDFNFTALDAPYDDLLSKGYIEAGSSSSIPAGSDKAHLTCCFGTSDGRSAGYTLSSRIDMGFHKNIPPATSYWLGNKSVPSTQEVAMSDHVLVKIGFTETSGPNNNPIIDTPIAADPNPAVANQTVTFTVTAHDPDGDPLTYTWAFGDTGQATTTSGTVQHAYPAAQNYTASVTITDGRGGSAGPNTVVVSVTSGGGASPPPPWTTADVGTGVSGTTTYSNGTFTLSAQGNDIWAGADAFHFVFQSWTGDGEIVARITPMTAAPGSAFTLGAVMMRGSLSASSAHASMMITNTGKAKFRRRLTDGGTTTLSDGPGEGTTPPPRYLKLTRAGNVFSAFISSNGSSWTPVAGSPATIALPSTVLVGLAAARSGGTGPSTVPIDNVNVRLPGSAWSGTDIGTVGPSGSQMESGSPVTVTAGGTDIWGTADAFRYVYQPLNGDGEIVAYISDLTSPPGAVFSLGGVMIRADLTPSSVHATMMATTEDKAKFRRRLTTGATTLSDGPSAGSAPFRAWLKLTRVGNTFTAYRSTDGVNWGSPVAAPATIAMPAGVYIGLVALRNGASAGTMTGTFNNVSVTLNP